MYIYVNIYIYYLYVCIFVCMDVQVYTNINMCWSRGGSRGGGLACHVLRLHSKPLTDRPAELPIAWPLPRHQVGFRSAGRAGTRCDRWACSI